VLADQNIHALRKVARAGTAVTTLAGKRGFGVIAGGTATYTRRRCQSEGKR